MFMIVWLDLFLFPQCQGSRSRKKAKHEERIKGLFLWGSTLGKGYTWGVFIVIKMQPVTAECYTCTLSVMLVHCTVLKYEKKRKENIIMVGVLGQLIFVPLTPITNEWFSTSFYYGRQSERGVLSSSFCPQTRDDGEKLNAIFFAGWMITDWGAYDTPCLVPVLARKVVHLWKKMTKEVSFGHRLKGLPE